MQSEYIRDDALYDNELYWSNDLTSDSYDPCYEEGEMISQPSSTFRLSTKPYHNLECVKKLQCPADDSSKADDSTKLDFSSSRAFESNAFQSFEEFPMEERSNDQDFIINSPVQVPEYIHDVWEFLMKDDNDEELEETRKKIQISQTDGLAKVQKERKEKKKNKTSAKMKQKEEEKIKREADTEMASEKGSTSSNDKTKTPSIIKNLKGSVATGFAQQLAYQDFLEVARLVTVQFANQHSDLLQDMTADELLEKVKDYISTEVRGKSMRDKGNKKVETYKVGTNDDIKRVLYPSFDPEKPLKKFVADITRTLLVDHFIGSFFYNRWVNLNQEILDKDILLSEAEQVRKVFAEPGYRFKMKKTHNSC
jgi:hypothetical protein